MTAAADPWPTFGHDAAHTSCAYTGAEPPPPACKAVVQWSIDLNEPINEVNAIAFSNASFASTFVFVGAGTTGDFFAVELGTPPATKCSPPACLGYNVGGNQTGPQSSAGGAVADSAQFGANATGPNVVVVGAGTAIQALSPPRAAPLWTARVAPFGVGIQTTPAIGADGTPVKILQNNFFRSNALLHSYGPDPHSC